MAIQPTLDETATTAGLAQRLRLPDVWELARRFSGFAAIAVLGLTMVTLTLRGEPEPERVSTPAAPAAQTQVEQTASAQMAQGGGSGQSADHAAVTQASTEDDPEAYVVYYLYETQEQYNLIQEAEGMADMESGYGFRGYDYHYYTIDVSTPEGAQQAREAVFEAMLSRPDHTRVTVEDVRGF